MPVCLCVYVREGEQERVRERDQELSYRCHWSLFCLCCCLFTDGNKQVIVEGENMEWESVPQ